MGTAGLGRSQDGIFSRGGRAATLNTEGGLKSD
jgi:hypothetical protein